MEDKATIEEISRDYAVIIKPSAGWFDLHIKDVWRYRDLILLFVKRTFTARYKQTILGPAWAIIQPLLTTLVFTLVFGNVAKLSPSGINNFVYYLCANILWHYFSGTFSGISHTFTSHSHIFSKVYFPRLVMPVATMMTGLISLGIQFSFFFVAWVIYLFAPNTPIRPNWCLALIPVLLMISGGLALGIGIIVSSVTTKYRDLVMLVGFGVHLWMYATPVAYSAKIFAGTRWYNLLWCNPMTPVIETFRYAFLGEAAATFRPEFLLLSAGVTAIVLFIGILLFSRVERTFMDVV